MSYSDYRDFQDFKEKNRMTTAEAIEHLKRELEKLEATKG